MIYKSYDKTIDELLKCDPYLNDIEKITGGKNLIWVIQRLLKEIRNEKERN